MKCVFNSHFNSFLLSLIYFKVNKTTKIAKKICNYRKQGQNKPKKISVLFNISFNFFFSFYNYLPVG